MMKYGIPQPNTTDRFGSPLEHWRPMSEPPTAETAPFGVWLGFYGAKRDKLSFSRVPLDTAQVQSWTHWQAVVGPVGDVQKKLPKLPDGFGYIQEPHNGCRLAIVSSPSLPEPTSSDSYVRYDALGVLRVVLQVQHASLLKELVDALNEANSP